MSLIKKDDPSFAITGGKLNATSSPFKRKLAESKTAIIELPNRLVLMLDKSGSMADVVTQKGESKIELLKQAVENFVNRCSPSDTAIAVRSFPAGVTVELTNVNIFVTSAVKSCEAGGGTPMRQCLVDNAVLNVTRAIIVSDGDATDWNRWEDFDNREESNNTYSVLKTYIDKKIPIDCVHIGDSSGGEARLRKIAELTGGLYIKFTDISAFSTAFGYLAPSYRAMLTDGTVDASQLGAKELKR